MARFPAPDRGYPLEVSYTPPVRPGATVVIPPVDPNAPKATLSEADARALATVYNGLHTQAAQAWLLNSPYGKANIGDFLAAQEGTRYYEWLTVASMKGYSGPAGDKEIAELGRLGWDKGKPAPAAPAAVPLGGVSKPAVV